MEIWRINLKAKRLQRQALPAGWERLGGRGLNARILLDEVRPACCALGRENKLVFAPGLLAGHMLSSCERISIGAKSPLTGGIKEANAGGPTALALAQLGIKALIIEEQLATGLWLLHISRNGIRLELADKLAGLGVYETAARLLERFGPKVQMALIGPAGEMKLSTAGIQNLDKDRVPSRIAARGGLGAVMGAQGLKAIVIDAGGGQKPSLVSPDDFRQAQKAYTQALLEHPQTAVYRDYGTAAMAQLCHHLGALPTRGFSSGAFEQVEQISGEHMRQLLLARGGASNPTHACMPGCTIRCSNVYGGADGEAVVAPLEYETIGLMGANLGLHDLDTIARLNWEANDLGVDTIDVGAALGVAAQAGCFAFGDGEGALRLLSEIRRGTPLGWIIGSGAAAAGKIFGIERVPVVKGQAMSAYDPRAIKGTGVTYATSPMGADHTAGLTIRAKVDHLDPNGQADLSRAAQINMAGYDSLGACIFAGFGFGSSPGSVPDLLNAKYGWQVESDILQRLGKETLLTEREFNRRAGFTPADDRLPDWMLQEALPPSGAVFDVPAKDLDGVFDWEI